MKNIGVAGMIVIAVVVFILAVVFVFVASQISEQRQIAVYQKQAQLKQAPLDECLKKVQAGIDSQINIIAGAYQDAHDPKSQFYACAEYGPSNPNPGGNKCPTLDELGNVGDKIEREMQPDKDECYKKYK